MAFANNRFSLLFFIFVQYCIIPGIGSKRTAGLRLFSPCKIPRCYLMTLAFHWYNFQHHRLLKLIPTYSLCPPYASMQAHSVIAYIPFYYYTFLIPGPAHSVGFLHSILHKCKSLVLALLSLGICRHYPVLCPSWSCCRAFCRQTRRPPAPQHTPALSPALSS